VFVSNNTPTSVMEAPKALGATDESCTSWGRVMANNKYRGNRSQGNTVPLNIKHFKQPRQTDYIHIVIPSTHKIAEGLQPRQLCIVTRFSVLSPVAPPTTAEKNNS
jgi:hypothetical protein